MVMKSFKCEKCGHIEDFAMNTDENTTDEVCRIDGGHLVRTFQKATVGIRNDSNHNPGGLNDWTKKLSLAEQASVYAGDRDPY